jgi:uncharacterized membrane-anchored protein
MRVTNSDGQFHISVLSSEPGNYCVRITSDKTHITTLCEGIVVVVVVVVVIVVVVVVAEAVLSSNRCA